MKDSYVLYHRGDTNKIIIHKKMFKIHHKVDNNWYIITLSVTVIARQCIKSWHISVNSHLFSHIYCKTSNKRNLIHTTKANQ